MHSMPQEPIQDSIQLGLIRLLLVILIPLQWWLLLPAMTYSLASILV
jgi:hypothetical protein